MSRSVILVRFAQIEVVYNMRKADELRPNCKREKHVMFGRRKPAMLTTAEPEFADAELANHVVVLVVILNDAQVVIMFVCPNELNYCRAP